MNAKETMIELEEGVALEDKVSEVDLDLEPVAPNRKHGKALQFALDHSSQIFGTLRLPLQIMYLLSGAFNAWPRAAGAGISMCSSLVTIFAKEPEQTEEEKTYLKSLSPCSYFLEMIKRSLLPHKHPRNSNALIGIISSGMYIASGIMSERYIECAAYSSLALLVLCFTLENKNAWIRFGVLMNATTVLQIPNAIKSFEQGDALAAYSSIGSQANFVLSNVLNGIKKADKIKQANGCNKVVAYFC